MKEYRSKSTVLVISMGFLLIHLLSGYQPFLYLSFSVGIMGLSDFLSRWIHTLWMGLAKLLSFIVPNILLTLVFYLILLPFALLFRMLNKDPLRLSSEHETYWVEEKGELDPESFKKPW